MVNDINTDEEALYRGYVIFKSSFSHYVNHAGQLIYLLLCICTRFQKNVFILLASTDIDEDIIIIAESRNLLLESLQFFFIYV